MGYSVTSRGRGGGKTLPPAARSKSSSGGEEAPTFREFPSEIGADSRLLPQAMGGINGPLARGSGKVSVANGTGGT